MVWRVADELLYTRRVDRCDVRRSARRARRAAAAELGDDRGLLRVRVDAAERRPLSAAGGCAGRSGRGRAGARVLAWRRRAVPQAARCTLRARPTIPRRGHVDTRARRARRAACDRERGARTADVREVALDAVLRQWQSRRPRGSSGRSRRRRRHGVALCDGAARNAVRLGRDVRGGARCPRRARARQPHGAHGALEHSLRAAGAGRRRVHALITTRRTPDEASSFVSARRAVPACQCHRRERSTTAGGSRREVASAAAVRAAQGHRRVGEAAVRHLRAQQQQPDRRARRAARVRRLQRARRERAARPARRRRRQGHALDAHVRELAILVACRATNYDFEWNAHEPAAVRAGVDAKGHRRRAHERRARRACPKPTPP